MVEIDPGLFRPYLMQEVIDQAIPIHIDGEGAVDVEANMQQMARGIDSITVDIPPRVAHRSARRITFYLDKVMAIDGINGVRIGKRNIHGYDWTGFSEEGHRIGVASTFHGGAETSYVVIINIDEEEYRIIPITDTSKHVMFEVDTDRRRMDRESEKGGIMTDLAGEGGTWREPTEEVITFPRHDLDITPPKKAEDIPPPPPLPSRDTLPSMEMLRDMLPPTPKEDK